MTAASRDGKGPTTMGAQERAWQEARLLASLHGDVA